MDIAEKTFGRLGNRLFQCAYIYAQFKDGNIPDIYLQDPKYFEKYADDIRQMFGQGIVPDSRVAIHVRRGDYVNNPFYVDLSQTTYYQNAQMQFLPTDRYLIFSDDINWCKEFFKHWPVDFSEGKSVDEDLRLMAGCKGIIMANSSLSWWGAFLGDPDKKVIYPKNWFTDGVQRVGVLSNWIGI